MSFHVSAWSIKNPVPTLVAFIIMTIVGIYSFLNLGIDNTPNIDVSAVIVNVAQPGAAPEEIETEITKKIEDAVASLADIDQLTSTVTDGSSQTVVGFELGTDTDQATNDVRNAIAEIRSSLPQDITDPVVRKLDFAGGAVMTYALSSDQRSVEELSDLIDRKISRELVNVKGVAEIKRLGGVDREIRVDLDPELLQGLGITASQVNTQIAQFNVNRPGGRVELGGNEQNVRTLGSAENIRELQQYPILLPNGDRVALAALGRVEDSFREPRVAATLDGQAVVAFSVLRSPGSTVVGVDQGIRKAIAELEKTLSEDLNFQLIFTRANEIQASYDGTVLALVAGCLLTVLTVGIFLKDWRATLITATALPLSIVPTFFVMQWLDYTLNGMTLLALALAIGNLVDDAICMIENIDQHLQMGKRPFQAAVDGAMEIGLAVVATTATIVAVFLPVAFMGGVPGQFFQPFGVTVAVSTMFSTLVATTMTPMLSAYLLKSKLDGFKADKQPGTYRNILTWALRHRITTLLIALAFFIGSLQLVPFIPKGLFSSSDTGISTVTFDLPPGSTLEDSKKVMAYVGDRLDENPAVKSVLATAENVNSGLIYVNLIDQAERISQKEFEREMRQEFRKIPGARVAFRSNGAGGGSKDLTIVLKSEDSETLLQTAQTLEKEMATIPGLVEIGSSASLVKPELIIRPDPQRAADLGVSVSAISQTASLALIGDTEFNLPKFNLSDRQIPIRVQLDPEKRQDIDTLKNLLVPSSTGELVPLAAVADLKLGSGSAQIDRFNRFRQVEVGANLEGVALGDAFVKVNALPVMSPLPPSVTLEPSGDAEIMRDIFSRFLTALGAAIMCIYAILVLLYNNFLYPLGILSALPLSVGGALIGLMIAQKELGLFALIGIVLLMGLVTKNAILLVDFSLAGMREGKTLKNALLDAGVSRLRPICMTSLSTIAGMTPIALELGADGATRSPMAIAVIGGFSTSTVLTLIVVPVLFTYIYNVTQFLLKPFRAAQSDPQPIETSQV
ncbi:efflux RND transporter permease subunit [[Limnothrix rosea] IAM M-220]|uniref:efflux RND transporter permease subunit n=1 Tax=[Limnothrix rosea] IAM M-220 TaxID=454133 RepID=UPI000961866B|nr:efflux RND transporter permease subunit [[Limnothrix rosea] IAM M-220]OKH18195.1 ABC transporter permease [[Limnothrix rosea] IAM M-220]